MQHKKNLQISARVPLSGTRSEMKLSESKWGEKKEASDTVEVQGNTFHCNNKLQTTRELKWGRRYLPQWEGELIRKAKQRKKESLVGEKVEESRIAESSDEDYRYGRVNEQ